MGGQNIRCSGTEAEQEMRLRDSQERAGVFLLLFAVKCTQL